MQVRSLVLIARAFSVLMGLALPDHGGAQETPTRPLRIVVPFSPGSGTDVIARLVGKAMGEQLKRAVVIDNKPGAAGVVAAQALLAEPAEGHTLMMVSSAYAVLPVSGRKLPFNPESDFDALGMVARSPNVLIASKASGLRSVAELVAAGRARREGLTFASSGVGTGTHLNAEVFASATGIRAVHIPMRGGPEIIGEIVSGRVDFAFVPPSQVSAMAADKFSALGVTGKERIRSLPDVATIAESGVPGFEYQLWYALLQRSGAPAASSEALTAALAKAMTGPAVIGGFQALGIEPMPLASAAARAFVRDEMARNRALVKSRGLQLNE